MGDNIAGYSCKEWEKISKQFERDFANSTKYNKSFSEMIGEVLDSETYMSFAEKVKLCENQLYRLRKRVDEKDPPQRNILLSVCVAYNLDLMMTQSLLHSLGLEFNRFNKRDYAYTFLLTRCRGKSIDECNKILKELELEKNTDQVLTQRNKEQKSSINDS